MSPDFEAPTPQSKSLKETTSDAGMKATASSQLPTLGERLAREAQRFTSVPVFPCFRLLDPLIKRVSSLPVPSQARFQRTEVSRVPDLSRPVSHEPSAETGTSWSGQLLPSPDANEQLIDEETGGWRQPFSLQPAVKALLSRGSSQALGQPLSPYVQQRLRDFVGPGTEVMRVHTDETANAITHAQRADAVTVGEQVFFRQGRFRPHEDEGFALLTHEATHVIQAMRPDSSWRRATQAGVQEEEQEASIQERKVLHAKKAGFLPQPISHRAPVSHYPARLPSSAHRPMTAPTERTLDKVTPPVPALPDIEDLKRKLYRDLMRQIRADLERGG